jgi:hypothetical protein
MPHRYLGYLFTLLAAFVPGCSCSDGTMPMGDGGDRTDARVVGDASDTPSAPDAFDVGGSDAVDSATMETGSPCDGVHCMAGAHCVIADGSGACVPTTCAELMCAATERCVPAPSGTGFVCHDNRCTDSIECAAGEFCDGTQCMPDVCVAGETSCTSSGAVQICAPDGSGLQTRFTCGGDAYFASMCTTMGGASYCPCEDDWDCPANTACEAGRCEGTGMPAMCRLAPAPFSSVLPALEPGFPWGGTGPTETQALGSPFPDSAQVVMTPLVVNLDDDNGDGLINELDTPEIVFLTFCNSEYTSNGVLRAVHGGGPQRGHDFFASCGGTVWHEGDATTIACACSAAELDSTAGLAAGDIDGDGVPEIVAMSESDLVRVYSNRGVLLAEATGAVTGNASPAIANVDNAGLAEIVVGNVVFTLERTASGLAFVDRFTDVAGNTAGTAGHGTNGQGPISCVANVAGGPEQEIIAGSVVYRMPTPPSGITRRSMCPAGSTNAFCTGQLTRVWDGMALNPTMVTTREGFCAVADVMGATRGMPPGPANPLDGVPEVVVVANGKLIIYDGPTGALRQIVDPGAGANGGAPNIDDFDGDGFPEIATAFATQYAMIDLQPPSAACPAWPNVFSDAMTGLQGNPARTVPTTACTRDADCGDPQFVCNATVGRCVCLPNGWRRGTEDDSSRVTGSTVFDFNGDGAAEAIYNDECYFRIYDGVSGAVLFREASESRTRTENPVVADTDNDGNAEIVFGTSNESGFCSDRTLAPRFNNGIEVWGDTSDNWVSARRVWNQHAYHVTNVFESGSVPTHEPESWRPYGGRLYNTYRSQPRAYGAAPNLTVDRIQMSSPDAACGTLSTHLVITARVVNRGDVRVGPDVRVGFFGVWAVPPLDEALHADAAMTPLETTLGTTLEPGGSTLVTVTYDALFNTPGTLPDQIRAVVDVAMRERECDETDNARTQPVTAGATDADLTVELGPITGTCPMRTFPTTVRNLGTSAASNVVVRYYLGDPAAGGIPFHDEVITGPIDPGGAAMISPSITFPDRAAVVYVVVDPDDAIPECNDANNTDHTPGLIDCTPG